MAGIDTDILGEARPQPDIKIGYLPQEPQLNGEKDVRGNVEEGVQEAIDALAGLEKIYADYAEPDADFDALAKEQARLEDIIQAKDAHNLDTRRDRSQCASFAALEANVDTLSGESVAVSPSHDCYCQNPICCCLMSPPTILMLNPWHGSSTSSKIFQERWSQLLTTAIFWTTRRAGFLSWIAGVASL